MLLSLQGKTPPAILALADGTVFQGQSLGASGQTVGEVVFNTSMTGYQEILTDPSYAHQLVTLTYPHIGNYGINAQDCESSQIHAQGLIIKDLPQEPSNFRSEQSLSSYLKSEGKLGICGLDTRALTRILRTKGAQNGAIVALEMGQSMTQETIAKAIELAKSAKSMAGLDLAKEVTTPKSYHFDEGEWQLTSGFSKPKGAKFKVVAFDFGVKKNILRMLVERGCEVTVVPAGKLLGVTGTWRGHHALDADAGEGTGRGFSSTRAPQGGMTSGSLARFTHDPIPSHILPPSQFTRTSQAIPTQLLKSLTRPQLC